ncbi:hypothetical protein COU54_03315 [Candidatus Pacearchaeota archaeon CG10_big_fil_rev_8_21_14_0_10_31_24]|nr:MAG: hypothetical protein COU54_03315 [Candidatus Pacearchaeota archaeon CG10_big_fil_rev_8_21_14_0_10_31_24]
MTFHTRTLSNGSTLIAEEIPHEINFAFGAKIATTVSNGVAHALEHMAFKGVNKDRVVKEIDRRSGMSNAATYRESTFYVSRVPAEYFKLALSNIRHSISKPLFPQGQFKTEMSVILEEVSEWHDNPDASVGDLSAEALYKSPFGKPILGSRTAIRSFTPQLLTEYWSKMYNPSRILFGAFGKFNIEILVGELNEELSKVSFKNGSHPLEKPSPKKKNSHFLVERPGLDQAHLLFCRHMPLPKDELYGSSEILNHYLGGTSQSFLFRTIREDRGLAYSVDAGRDGETDHSCSYVLVGTDPKNMSLVGELIRQGYNSASKMTRKTFKEAQEIAVDRFKYNIEGPEEKLEELVSYVFSTGRITSYSDMASDLKNATVEQVRHLAKLNGHSTLAMIPTNKRKEKSQEYWDAVF